MPEYYNAVSGRYMALTHAATILTGTPTLRSTIGKISQELGIAFHISNSLRRYSPVADVITVVELPADGGNTPTSLRWYSHTESIHLNMTLIWVLRGNVSYTDLLGAVQLFRDKDNLTYLVQITGMAQLIQDRRATWLNDVNYELAEVEIRIQELYEKQLVLERGVGSWDADWLEGEVAKLRALPTVARVDLLDSRYINIVLAQESVIPLDMGREVHLGPFTIKIDLSNINTSHVLFLSDGPEVGSNNHPHISSGHACWGNLITQVARFLYRLELVSFLEICMVFLSTWYPDDHYCSAYRFLGEAEDQESMDDMEIEDEAVNEGWTDAPTRTMTTT